MMMNLWILVLAGLIAGSLSAVAQPLNSANEETSGLVAVSGELEVIVEDDFARGHSARHYFVVEANGSRTQLRLSNPPGNLHSGQRVTVRGHSSGENLDVTVLELDASAELQATVTGGAEITSLPAATEQRPAIVLMVDLLDARASDRYSLEQLSEAMFTGARSVDELYREASYFQTSIPGDADRDGWADVFGPFTVDYYASCYGYNNWAAAADASATEAGIDLSLYRHRVYVVPHYSDLGCGWAGLGNLGCGETCRVWIANADSPTVFAHELAHNYRMNHASTDWDNDGVVEAEYGDRSDPVGAPGRWRIFNAPHMDQMGWFEEFPSAMFEAVTGGVHTLYPLSVDPDESPGLQALKVPKPDTREFYYLSYRQPIGYDADLSPFYTSGVSLHRYANGTRTYFIDVLEDGLRFVDSTNEIQITQLNVASDGSYAQVEVALDCADASPSLDVTPVEQSVAPYGVASYAVEIANRDFAGCPESIFDLTLSLPLELSGTIAPSQLTLSPGEITTVSLQVTAGAAAGRLGFEVATATYPNGIPGRGTLLIDATAPSTPSLTGRVKRKTQVLLDWTAASDGDGSGLSHYVLHRVDSLGGALDFVVRGQNYTDTDTTSGNIYTYTVNAIDLVGNASPPSNSIAVEVGGGSRGGGGTDGNGGGKKK